LGKERKTQILKAAIKRFTRHGVNKTTLNEIARDLRIGKATIYHYFTSKEDLYYASVNWHTDEYIDEIDSIFKKENLSIEQKFFEYFLYKENIFEHHQLLYDLFLQLMMDPDKEKESGAIKYLLKNEEEIMKKFLDVNGSKKADDNFPLFIVLQSWGMIFSGKLNLIFEKDSLISSKERLIDCCLKYIIKEDNKN
jgi:AcrR family transcriptional regulator